MSYVIGLDLSMSNIGLSMWNKETKECKELMLFSTQKSLVNKLKNSISNLAVYTVLHVANDNIANACYVSRVLCDVLKYYDVSLIAIEDYAYTMFKSLNIAEFTGVVKYHLQKNICRDIIPFSISTIKKFATGNGRAPKDDMIYEFMNEINAKSISRIAYYNDIADAYYIGKYAIYKVI